MADTFQKYGALWPVGADALQIEQACIKKGGKWIGKKSGLECGKGMFYHYKAAQTLMWPDDDHHRWSDLMLSEILQNKHTVIIGPKDSGKSYSALAKFGLTDYLMFPDETLTLISSTDLRGLELRVWGALKDLWRRAKERYDWLSGKPLDSKHAICTDDITEDCDIVRDMRKGIICIPCRSTSGAWLGVNNYVGLKQKRRRLLSDECFPAGTQIDTPEGKRPIETIKPGDIVISAAGESKVRRIGSRITTQMVEINTKDGRTIRCTPEHPFLTQEGWKKACHINQRHYMLSAYETLSILHSGIQTNKQQSSVPKVQRETSKGKVQTMRGTVHQRPPQFDSGVLRSILRFEMAPASTGFSKEVLHEEKVREYRTLSSENIQRASREIRGALQQIPYNNGEVSCFFDTGRKISHEGTVESVYEKNGIQAESSRREWNRANQSRESVVKSVSSCHLQSSREDWNEERKRFPSMLQVGHRFSQSETWGRGGRRFSFYDFTQGAGREKDNPTCGTWVDSVEVLEQKNFGRHEECSPGTVVYNLEVENHPSYSVEGLICHNCQFMADAFMDAPASLDGADFKAVIVGHPLGQLDPLDKFAEPEGGWGTEGDIKKTTVWKNKLQDGHTINLVGTDSPNFDHPQVDGKCRYPYLVNQKMIDGVVSFYGKDSTQYWSKCLGIRRTGMFTRRVITMKLCEQSRAFEQVTWKGKPLTRIYGLDPAFGGIGGDRCVGGYVEYGEDMEGKIILLIHPPVIVPVSVRYDESPEDQIARYVMNDCVRLNITPENVFFDSTARGGGIVASFARLWSGSINPVEFGGKATNRAVTLDHFINDPITKQRRLKLCHEEYSKLVTEFWFSVRYTIESGQMRELPKEVAEEGCQREWIEVSGGRTELETKADMKERTGRSPDLFDWLAVCVEGARRKGFQISKLANQESESDNTEWLDELARKQHERNQRKQLNYAA